MHNSFQRRRHPGVPAMTLKKLYISLIIAISLCCLNIGNAGSLNGGDAASAATADTFVDIVFAIDTSGSMGGDATSISNNIQSVVEALECLDVNVWVKARFLGLDGTWGGTLFDEVAETVLATAGDSVTINHSEDNGPVVYDFAVAQNYWLGPENGGQTYQKAVVTIGDEGLQNGGSSGQDQDDYDVGKLANDAAIANDTVVFSIIGSTPYSGAVEIFTALAEGGATLGGHQFNATGGFAISASGQDLQTRLEAVLCQAATVNLEPVDSVPIPTLSPWILVFLATLLAYFGYVGLGRRLS